MNEKVKLSFNCAECDQYIESNQKHDFGDCMKQLKARVAELESGLDRVLTQLQLLANMSEDPLFELTIVEFAEQIAPLLKGGGS